MISDKEYRDCLAFIKHYHEMTGKPIFAPELLVKRFKDECSRRGDPVPEQLRMSEMIK
jgi:hypothetical protein